MITSLTVNSFTVVIVHCSRNFNRSDILSHFPNDNEKTSLAKVLEDSAYYTNPLPLGLILFLSLLTFVFDYYIATVLASL